MISINKVSLQGNLGSDVEVKYLPSGDAVASFSIATNERWKDKTTNEVKQNTEWHRVVAFKRLAEIASEYLRKGQAVHIEGKLRTRSWDDANTGQKKYITEIVANQLLMGNKNDDSPSNKQNVNKESSGNDGNSDDMDFEDDIPF